jgi:hypothetical protein
MADNQTTLLDPLLDAVPPPAVVRNWLARSIRQSALLRSLLRLAEHKANLEERAACPRKGVAHAE